jgi:hypothetical protein
MVFWFKFTQKKIDVSQKIPRTFVMDKVYKLIIHCISVYTGFVECFC